MWHHINGSALFAYDLFMGFPGKNGKIFVVWRSSTSLVFQMRLLTEVLSPYYLIVGGMSLTHWVDNSYLFDLGPALEMAPDVQYMYFF